MTDWRRSVRRGAVAVGAGGLVVAFALDWAVGAEVVPSDWAALGLDDSVVVAGFTTVAVCAVALAVNHRWLLGSSSALSAAAPESPTSVLRSGADFDDTFRGVFPQGHRTDAPRQRTRERLREAAVRTVARQRSVPRERAVSLVERGDWTDDDVAAAFLGDPSAPNGVRVRRLVSTRLAFRYQVRRSARAVVAADGRDDP